MLVANCCGEELMPYFLIRAGWVCTIQPDIVALVASGKRATVVGVMDCVLIIGGNKVQDCQGLSKEATHVNLLKLFFGE